MIKKNITDFVARNFHEKSKKKTSHIKWIWHARSVKGNANRKRIVTALEKSYRFDKKIMVHGAFFLAFSIVAKSARICTDNT